MINTSFTYSEVLSKLGYSTRSANNKIVKEICKCYNLDTSHFTHSTLKDLTGLKVNRLTVLYRDKTKPSGHQKPVYWVCKCDCGNITSITTNHLTRGDIYSCGCYRNEKVKEAIGLDLVGKRFGKLTVIKDNGSVKESSGETRRTWLCKCDCGNETIVKTINLQSGDTQSCGCLVSAGENRIEFNLKQLNIEYKKEYPFIGLNTENGYPMRFDFAIFKNNNLRCLIEYQGIGHYEEGDWLLNLKIRKERDEKKRKYCEENNIPLIEVPYWDFDKINENYIKERLDEYIN